MVDMRDFEFEPATLRVAPMARVAFRNLDDQVHTATSEAPGFDTGNVDPGRAGEIVAPSAPGAYAFYCVHHAAIGERGSYEGMVGILEVVGEGSDGGSARTPAPGAAIALLAILSIAALRAGRRGRARGPER